MRGAPHFWAHHVINSREHRPPPTREAREETNNLTPPKTMSADAGCCDASPWMSWNWWWEPIRGYTRQRSQAEQEMIEACTTPRSGRTSFDE